MFGYKRILIATDLSQKGQNMLEKALSMAQARDAECYIIHVIEHFPIAYEGEFSIPMDMDAEQKIEIHAMTILQKIANTYRLNKRHITLAKGSVKAEVTQLAQKIKADLIVVGSHGHSAIDLLLGSRANAILHHAQCDVWVLK